METVRFLYIIIDLHNYIMVIMVQLYNQRICSYFIITEFTSITKWRVYSTNILTDQVKRDQIPQKNNFRDSLYKGMS